MFLSAKSPASYAAKAAAVALLVLANARRAESALKWDGCADLSDSDFRSVTLVSRSKDAINEPMKMAFDLIAQPGEDAAGKVDVYFTERHGNLRKYDAGKQSVLTLGTFSMNIGATSADGLLGIALDPQFKSNHWIYLDRLYTSGSLAEYHISRFALNEANDKLDMASEKIILKVPTRLGSEHPGGALQFDAYGDLWITTGNDYHSGESEFPVGTSANTGDLRAKLLRIHPNADGTYSIPDGNLFPKHADGTPVLAKTRTEIYVMGTRNPYTLSLDPVRRWAVFGDVGPDEITMDGTPMADVGVNTEEHDLVTEPGNLGYPFFAGQNLIMKKGMNPALPIVPADADWGGIAKGRDTLPPAVPAVHAYPRGCAVTGPIYRYDGDLNSSVKMPPHLNRKWFVTDFNPFSKNPITVLTLSDDGKQVLAEENIMKGVTLYQPLDMQAGPDGALYVSNYSGNRNATANTSIVRIEYTGTCRPALPKLEQPGSTALREPQAQARRRLEILPGPTVAVRVTAEGAFRIEVEDARGRRVGYHAGYGNTRVSLDEVEKAGVYFLKLDCPQGRFMRTFVLAPR